ncbi:hypothetical protein OIDMADRAFT_157136 [Oidiodendron maius Zn]|uniref:DNA helicase n=1 Tax=Oidiodendron maius (strain Zn) TaxID=913774 RepID=A0A0C3H977_OIDMZ|nr:hypothetical protein OIDMADRAFT_157136 [Oidiodendron maius Zn]
MSSFFNARAGAALVPDSPAVKRQKTASGYHSTSTSADNTGTYNSDVDSGDDLFRDYIPDTPAHATFHTQPTQIIDRSGPAPSSPPGAPGSIVEVAASSPFQIREADAPNPSAQRPTSKRVQDGPVRTVQKLALSMAPAGTVYRPPPAIAPARTYITIDDEDDGPQFQGGNSVKRVRDVFPRVTVLSAKNALVACKGNLDDAILLLYTGGGSVVVSDDEIVSPQPAKKQEPQMKRVLEAPVISIKDRYKATQVPPTQKSAAATPPKPKKRLVQGRRNPSSPAAPPAPSPIKAPASPTMLVDDYESDSGVASATEEDPDLGDRVLKYLNTCNVNDLVELTGTSKANAELMIAARPFRNLDAARNVSNPMLLKSGKRSAKVPLGDKIVATAVDMFSGYEAIDALVTKCEELGKPLAEEMGHWGFDVFGAAKDGELEMTSFGEDSSSQRDSGIGSPSSGVASVNGDGGDDDIKIVAVTRKKGPVNYLKKPEMMAEDCTLKDYQVVGLNWLALMYRHKLSGILADEMGLGKTCQVISLLTHLVETGNSGPHLVICPGSTLENWLREFPKFSPKLAVEPYYGAQKERAEMAESILERCDTINVIVTTYDLAAKKEDNKFLRRLRPDMLTLLYSDEGHYLKNLNSQRYQGLVKVPAKFKLLLTGTPLQNNLQELAALLAFILPNVFMERQEDLNYIFKAKATTKDTGHAALLSAERIARARSMLTPFVLRRKKAQVLKHLPAKSCRVEYCTLHPAQKEIYDGHIEQARERARIRVEGGKIPKTDENNPLMQLRKAAIHPLLFRRHFTNEKIEIMADILRKNEPVNFPACHKRVHLIEEMRSGSDYWLHQWCLDYPCISSFDIPDLAWLDSGKVDAMVKLVKQYKQNGDRVLIFSQFALVLDILEAVLNSSLVSFTRIDGSTKIDERQTLIDTFRDDETITAFLLTTKAGGTGINLMYANKVIIFDGSFNPQDDKQAENRAHRVGQTRSVEVVRLVTRGTIEEQIWALGKSKLALDGRVAGDDDAANEEAGEKAVSKMLLEGIRMTDKDAEAQDESSEKENIKEPEGVKKEATKKTSSPSRSQRKKNSILDFITKRSVECDEGNDRLV